jgi:hypothetical protein
MQRLFLVSHHMPVERFDVPALPEEAHVERSAGLTMKGKFQSLNGCKMTFSPACRAHEKLRLAIQEMASLSM